LWFAAVQQHHVRPGMPPPRDAIEIIAGGLIPAIAMAAIGWLFARYVGRAPYLELERREWWHALWWSFVPNALLFVTVWLMVLETS
jgi:hypothetical protein